MKMRSPPSPSNTKRRVKTDGGYRRGSALSIGLNHYMIKEKKRQQTSEAEVGKTGRVQI